MRSRTLKLACLSRTFIRSSFVNGERLIAVPSIPPQRSPFLKTWSELRAGSTGVAVRPQASARARVARTKHLLNRSAEYPKKCFKLRLSSEPVVELKDMQTRGAR